MQRNVEFKETDSAASFLSSFLTGTHCPFVSPPMPVASTNRANYKPFYSPSSHCVGCTSATGLDCTEPLCSSSNALTAQCTDQCVVIACSDPDHTQSICDGAGPHTHCDLVCDEAVDCVDCHGFDAFLQCCGEYRPCDGAELSRTSFPANTHIPSAWDTAFEEWCAACAQPETAKLHLNHERPINLNESTPLAGERETNSVFDKTIQLSHHHSFQTNSSPQTPQPSPKPSPPVNCLWSACDAAFPSLSELVGHVNLNHLYNSPSLSMENINDAFDRNANHNGSPISCLWNNCGSSYYSSSNSFELLANHFMNEHLASDELPHYQQHNVGHHHQHTQESSSSSKQNLSPSMTPCLPAPTIPQNTFVPDMNQQMRNDEPLSQITAPSNHSCTTGAHECRWKDCALSFHTCDDLTAHINDVHIGGGKARYECFWDQCTRNGSQGFQSKQKICRHVQSHTGHRPFQCSICQQNFSEAATLQQHIRRHTQEKPYVCDYPGCGKSFAITGALTIHKRTHNGDKPFKCTYCDRGFAESSNLSKHLRTHTGARPYTCMEPGCNKAFARPDQLNRHKGVHRKQIRGVGRTAVEE
ncbi:hypothetical protein BDZ97DRAFT_141232 [Flammula alnicola]|nr:hypothetical protein BDZ97DRAFT_141232 [Flammula alnicola]